VPSWWERHRSHIPPFYVVYAGDDEEERAFEFTEHLRTRQDGDLAELSQSDSTIRDILSTVASLGAARDAFKISRIALYVALASLVVAACTLLVTDIGSESVAAHIATWLQNLCSVVRHSLQSWMHSR
jgi:hypothetical protein